MSTPIALPPIQGSDFLNSRLNAIKHMKKSIHICSQDTISKIITKIDKEKIILDLRTELNYVQTLQGYYQSNLDTIHSIVKDAEKNQLEISAYCTSLRTELKDFVEKIDWYESRITTLTQDTEQLRRTNDAIITLKENEQSQLEAEDKKIQGKINEQLLKIKTLKDQYQTLDQRKKKEKKEFEERENKDKQEYNMLFKKHRNIANKFNVYEQDDEASDLTELRTQRRIYKERIMKEELNIKLNDEKVKGEMLRKEYDDINEKVQRLSLEAIEDVKKRFSSLQRGIYTKKYSNSNTKDYIHNSMSLSSNKFSTMFKSDGE